MLSMMKRRSSILWALLMMAVMAPAQTQPQKEALSIQGYSGQASVIRFQKRVFLDVRDLAEITNGSLSFEGGGIILTLPDCDASDRAGEDAGKAGFSRAFMRAAIESMASIREWGGMLQATLQNRYSVDSAMTGNTVIAYQKRAAESVGLASAAASTDSDYHGLELLRNEFNNLQVWSDRLVQDRNSLTATHLTMSESPLKDDDEAQKILRCGQFLAQMFAGGTFQDDAVCH